VQRLIAGFLLLVFAGTAFAQDIPDEARRQLTETVGGPYVVFRDKVQDDLKLSTEQNEKLGEKLQERVQDAMGFFQKLEGVGPEEREKELGGVSPQGAGKSGGVPQGDLEGRSAQTTAATGAATGRGLRLGRRGR